VYESLQETYPKAWRQFWKLRILLWLSWALWIPAIIGNAFLSIKIRSFWGAVLTLLPACFTLFTYSELRSFSCPRCHKQFLVGVAIWPIFLQNACFNCGLPKYAN